MAILEKIPTGIRGFDEITEGGLPSGRCTLIAGGPGSGKTMFAMQFLLNGSINYDEPGIFMSFEEKKEDLAKNFSSLGFDIDELAAQKKVSIDYVRVERKEISETGEYDLEGLFVRLDYAIKKIGAKRVVLDTIESLFSGLSNGAVLRAELRRLFEWLKDHGMTTVITGERGDGSSITRQGLEEYVSDCVILLDNRIYDQVATRRLRIVKYRGSVHGQGEYPFLFDDRGMSVLPVSSLKLEHQVSEEHILTGVNDLDAMMDNVGYFKGSTILVTGTAGTGKSTMSASLTEAACTRGEKVLYFSFEESPRQLKRNMRSVGIDLEQYEKKGLLKFHATRPTAYGLESHLLLMQRAIQEEKPSVVIVDPLSNLIMVGTLLDVKSMLIRLVDYLKAEGITAMFSSLSSGSETEFGTVAGISSIIDSWIVLRDVQEGREIKRELVVLKSRGMPHSRKIGQLVFTEGGLKILT
jgi:circadian clock protein KaiC